MAPLIKKEPEIVQETNYQPSETIANTSKHYERNSGINNRKVLDNSTSQKESAENKIKELASRKTDEYKELELKFRNLEATNNVLAENLK